MQIAPRPLARKVRIVDRRADADRFCRPAEEIAHVVREILQDVCAAGEAQALGQWLVFEYLVEKDGVVRRCGGALGGRVRLEVKVPVEGFGNAAVDDGTADGIRRLRIDLFDAICGVGDCACVEAGVVALSYDDEGDVGDALLA